MAGSVESVFLQQGVLGALVLYAIGRFELEQRRRAKADEQARIDRIEAAKIRREERKAERDELAEREERCIAAHERVAETNKAVAVGLGALEALVRSKL